MELALLFFLCYLALCLYFWAENRRCRHARRSFSHVIHVGGIRGKTTVCRMLDAVLRRQHRVMTKTTGTDARIIDTAGVDLPLRRLGPPNIKEQTALLLRAQREGAEIVVAECMAVLPELQRVCQQQILKGDIVVITNVRYDHMYEMGETLDEIAKSLCEILPDNGTLFTADRQYFPLFAAECEKRNSRVILCIPAEGEDENSAVVRQIARHLSVPDAEIDSGLDEIQQDFGVSRLYRIKNQAGEDCVFLNLFSVNDPQSTLSQLAAHRKAGAPVYFVYNHRADRPDRLLLFIRHFFSEAEGEGIFLMGGGLPLARRLLKRSGQQVSVVRNWRSGFPIPAGALLVGIGNIKGPGYRMIEALEERGCAL